MHVYVYIYIYIYKLNTCYHMIWYYTILYSILSYHIMSFMSFYVILYCTLQLNSGGTKGVEVAVFRLGCNALPLCRFASATLASIVRPVTLLSCQLGMFLLLMATASFLQVQVQYWAKPAGSCCKSWASSFVGRIRWHAALLGFSASGAFLGIFSPCIVTIE